MATYNLAERIRERRSQVMAELGVDEEQLGDLGPRRPAEAGLDREFTPPYTGGVDCQTLLAAAYGALQAAYEAHEAGADFAAYTYLYHSHTYYTDAQQHGCV